MLIDLSDSNEEFYNKQYKGKKVEVLWEEEKNGISKGHTSNYILVESNQKRIENNIETVEIKKAEMHYIST